MPNSYLDKWRSSSQTQAMGFKARRRSTATRAFSVDGLTNDNTLLQAAIDQVLSDHAGSGDDRYHHNDTDLPMASITARHYGGNKAIGEIQYRHILSNIDLTRSAKEQAERRGGSQSFRWWRDTSSFDTDDRPNGSFIFHPYSSNVPDGQRRPLSWTFKMGITYITLNTLLNFRPSIQWSEYAYQINSNIDAQWLVTGAFPAKSLLFLPPSSYYIDGRYLVQWRVAYNPRKWQYYSTPVFNPSSGNWEDSVVDAFPARTFNTVPVHQ